MSKLDQAHLDALHILLSPLIKAKSTHIGITWEEAERILKEWDKARTVKP